MASEFSEEISQQLSPAIARDARYPIEAYVLVVEALERAKEAKRRERISRRPAMPQPGFQARSAGKVHVTGAELCHAARELLSERFGLMALAIARAWEIHATSDLGEIVYNLISTGDLEATPSDARSDFDAVFDFESALVTSYRFSNMDSGLQDEV